MNYIILLILIIIIFHLYYYCNFNIIETYKNFPVPNDLNDLFQTNIKVNFTNTKYIPTRYDTSPFYDHSFLSNTKIHSNVNTNTLLKNLKKSPNYIPNRFKIYNEQPKSLFSAFRNPTLGISSSRSYTSSPNSNSGTPGSSISNSLGPINICNGKTQTDLFQGGLMRLFKNPI